MPRPRRTPISLEDTPWYHAVSRCVRKAWLTGVDPNTGQSYEHRREQVESQLLKLGAIFAIDIAAYAVMSNHLHLVLRIDIELANSWTDREIVEQWHLLFKGTELTQRFATFLGGRHLAAGLAYPTKACQPSNEVVLRFKVEACRLIILIIKSMGYSTFLSGGVYSWMYKGYCQNASQIEKHQQVYA